MNLHEYQAKALFADYGAAVPVSRVVTATDQVPGAIAELGGERWVVKAQIHAGGRGKAGGVKLLDSPDAVAQMVGDLLGTRLVTFQSGPDGQPVERVLIEAPSDIARELYLGMVIDRSLRRVVVMASTEGGMEIEKVAEQTPEKILKAVINPLAGVQPFQARDLAFGLGLQGDQLKQFGKLLGGLVKLFHDKDLSLLEVNPLVVTSGGDVVCLDAKINLDGSALYRHPDLQALHDPGQEDPREMRAREWDLNYISLDGDIGCMVNGAGLAMATMDLIKLHGGDPANFLDVGGTATQERTAEAFKIILSDHKVKGILVNIFGGIVRCDMIAEGIVGAVKEVGVQVPIVVRLEGNNAERGQQILNDSGLAITAASGLDEATRAIVAAVKEAGQ